MDTAPLPVSLPFTPAPVAAWQSVATLAKLPPALRWSGTQPIPAIGAPVHAYLNGFGAGEVRAYFHADGWLGVVVAITVLPEWFAQQNPGITEGHFFGREVEPYEQAAPQLPAAA